MQLLSPLFLKYQADYEKNPRSRVFAPLAEMYRKAGVIDKAMEILSQGVRFHPTYTMGFLGLAFCYYDLRQYNLAYTTLKPFVESNVDNIRLQKLFINICIEMDYIEESLQTCKYLLFINPRDKEIAQKVALLEKRLEERYQTVHRPIFIPEKELSSPFATEKLETRPVLVENDFDDWKTVDFAHKSAKKNSPTNDNDHDQWAIKKIDEKPLEEKESDQFHFEVKSPEVITLTEREAKEIEAPLVTHTLVDLYCGQGHIEKALEILEKILILNPDDQKTLDKISEIKLLMGELREDHSHLLGENNKETAEQAIASVSEDNSEEVGRKSLMDLIDQKLGQGEIVIEATSHQIIEDRLNKFLEKIQAKALAYQSRL